MSKLLNTSLEISFMASFIVSRSSQSMACRKILCTPRHVPNHPLISWNRRIFLFKLTENNLFIKSCMECTALKKTFHYDFYFLAALPNQLSNQAVGTGVYPVTSDFACIQEIYD